jgi:multidrug efflux pump subunit AcrA (membrane-fusion protein)
MTEHHDPHDMPEGEEQAPPGTRGMAVLRWALVALMGLAAVGAWTYFAADSGLVRTEQRYHCPMHPQIVTTHKGECPICGMDLVPIPAGSAAPAAAGGAPAAGAAPPGASAAEGHADHPEYTCPMHPEFVTTDPKARCPECGMKLVPREPAAGAQAGHADHPEYTCPMHPEFVTTDPKARCPECGMKLVPREPDAGAAAGGGVAGLAPVELTTDRIQLSGMRTAIATRETLAPVIRTAGFVAADEKRLVSVTTRVTGWIESLGSAETGKLVGKGEVLATLYSPDLVNAQQVFLNALRWSEGPTLQQRPSGVTDLERDARARLAVLGVSPQDIDAVAQAGKPLPSMNVRAPARGHITRRAAVQGLYVSPGTELFQIADLSTVWVLADVYEREIARVKVGQRAVFESSAWPGERFVGKVTFLSPALNTGTRTLQARLEFRNADLRLRPGMYGDVSIDLGAEEAVTIPREALVDTGEVQYVFVSKSGGRFEPRRVVPGWSGGDKVAILKGLAEGEHVVTTATFLLDSESRLRAAIEGFTPAGGSGEHAGH